MDDSTRVQTCGTRVGLVEVQKQEGENTMEEVHSASFTQQDSREERWDFSDSASTVADVHVQRCPHLCPDHPAYDIL